MGINDVIITCYALISYKTQSFKSLTIPSIFLHGKLLEFTSKVKYLGVLISDNLSDKDDMQRHKKLIYAKGNYLIRYFKKCSSSVKTKLFETFCNNIYSGHLWVKYTASDLRSVKVAFNNVYRFLFNVKLGASISLAMLYTNVDNFTVILRKQAFSFMERLSSSHNVIVSIIFKSTFFKFYSCMSDLWKSILY